MVIFLSIVLKLSIITFYIVEVFFVGGVVFCIVNMIV